MVYCKTCSRVVLLDLEYCREHYNKFYKLPHDIPKYKERAWRDHLQYSLLKHWGVHLEYDKKLVGTNIKPDLHFFFLGVLFIIEIDEFQHKFNLAYDEERNEKRYEVLKLFSRVHFLRINTDKNAKREGVFTRKTVVNKVDPGINVTMEVNEKEFTYRKKVVDSVINSLLVGECEKYGEKVNYFGNYISNLKIYKLFYDE